jgi:hypothetical protein
MHLEDVTPEWVLSRMQERGLLQAQVAVEIGIEQHKLSKSLNHKRRFTVAEREKLARLLCEPEPPELEPEPLEMARRFAALSDDRRALMMAMVEALEAQQEAALAPRGNGAQDRDS